MTVRRRGVQASRFAGTGPLLGLAFSLLALAGCGYRTGLVAWQDAASPPGARIAVPLMQNLTRPYRRGIEANLTEAVIQEILARTPLEVVPAAQADVVLEGVITGYAEGVLAEDASDRVAEGQVTLSLSFSVKDLRSGEYRVRNRVLTETAAYLVLAGQPQDEARDEAFRSFAERVVYQLGESW